MADARPSLKNMFTFRYTPGTVFRPVPRYFGSQGFPHEGAIKALDYY